MTPAEKRKAHEAFRKMRDYLLAIKAGKLSCDAQEAAALLLALLDEAEQSITGGKS